MALPNLIDPASPPDSQAPSLGDDRIRELKQAIIDILGITSSENVTVSYFTGGASGLVSINFSDASSFITSSGDAGMLFRESNTLRFADETHNQHLNGTLSWQSTVVGNTGAGEDDLMSYTIPASFLTQTSGVRMLEIIAAGTFADTAGNKTLKFKVGAGTSITLNGVTAGPQNKMWWVHMLLYRSQSNQQYIIGQFVIDPGSTEGPVNGTGAETDTSAIIIKFTGESAGGTTNDVTQKFMLVRAAGAADLT